MNHLGTSDSRAILVGKVSEGHGKWSKVKAVSKFIPFGSQQFSTIQTKSRENGHKFAYQNRLLANPIFLMFQRWILSRISQQRPHQFSRTGHIMSMAIFNGSRLSTMAVQWWSECGTNETCGIIRHYYEIMMIKTFVESAYSKRADLTPESTKLPWFLRKQLPEPVPDLTTFDMIWKLYHY